MFEKILNLGQQEIWIYGIFITATMGIAGIVLTHVLAGKRDKRSNLISASIAFRFAIDVECLDKFDDHHLLLALDHGLVGNPGEKIEGEYFKHKRAVREFRSYLGIIDRCRLDRAWEEYHGGDEEHPDLGQYCFQNDGHKILKRRLCRLKNIGNKK